MCEYDEKIDREKALDYAIRDYECKKFPVESGYKIGNKPPYWNYLSNGAWEKFKDSMKKVHRRQFEDADGGELKEKKGRWGICPPKMASFGSSSRFLYNISKDIVGFQFEKLLPTRVGGTANLDGYIMRGDVDVFVEAKCREIYSSHIKVEVSKVYQEVYDKLAAEKDLLFSYEEICSKDKEHFDCTFKVNGKVIVHFDIKQLICHFLAISANILENVNANKNIKFVYLIFNPRYNTCFDNERISHFNERIINIYDDTKKEIESFYMKRLFDAIFDIQTQRLELQGKQTSFEFCFADQTYYKENIK